MTSTSLENTNKYALKHSLDLRMNPFKEFINGLKKLKQSKLGSGREDNADPKSATTFRQRVFLYLQPKSITYPLGDMPSDRVEIELEHHYNTIDTLGDYFMARNIIDTDQLNQIKPTFSITLEQDCYENLALLSDSPVMLTLHVHKQRNEESEEEHQADHPEDEERIPVAQGYIDVLEYFSKKRSHYIETVYLYPFKAFGQILTCKSEWEIYSLHPLLKNLIISNVLFITMGSIYNLNEELMQNGESLGVNLSLISKTPNEKNQFVKIFICKFSSFTKGTICDQNLSIIWETLKTNSRAEELCAMGIATEAKFTLSDLFTDKLCTENIDFHFDDINISEDYAVISNSVHRYILTDTMQAILEQKLAANEYQIVIDIYCEPKEHTILLQGFMDLSIFMYPKVKHCSYAIELKQPDINLQPAKPAAKGAKVKAKIKNQEKEISRDVSSTKEDKIPFIIVSLCVNNPITNPPQDLSAFSNFKSKQNKYSNCRQLTKMRIKNTFCTTEEVYINFDDLILEILDYMIRNKIKEINDDKEFFCSELSNLTNKIMRLVSNDFNIRIPTKTNIEFTNLLTTVYQELVHRIYNNIQKCSIGSMENCVLTTPVAENLIATNISIAKCMYEVGNSEMADYLIDAIRSEYPNNPTIGFYIFLYNIERRNLELANEYLKLPLCERDIYREQFTAITQIYINYKLQLQDPIESSTAEGILIKTLTDYSVDNEHDSLTGWILLYCLYKKCNYQPGMSYCRYKYENLYSDKFFPIEFIPKSRWSLYMPYKMKFKSQKGTHFIKVFRKLLCLGLYDFAKWIFDEIANECLEVERYFVLSTFLVLNPSTETNIAVQTFPIDKMENATQLKATLAQVNGNLEYFSDPASPRSFAQYKEILKLNDLENLKSYELAFLRYGFHMMTEEQYEEASKAFGLCCCEQTNCLIGAIGKGKACYYLGQLTEAEKYFDLSTQHGIYMPNVWGYLAIINLKRGNNYNALECWKYARLNHNKEIHQEILNELNKIKIDDVFLYVDVPNDM